MVPDVLMREKGPGREGEKEKQRQPNINSRRGGGSSSSMLRFLLQFYIFIIKRMKAMKRCPARNLLP